MAALGEVVSELAAVLRPMVHDVRDDQPSRPREIRTGPPRLVQRRIVEGLHEAPQAGVLFDAERMDRREVVQHEPVVPHVRVSHVVPDAELTPAPVDVDEMSDRLEGTAVVENVGSPELFVRQAGGRRQDLVVRPSMEPDEPEQALSIHAPILGPAEFSSPGTSDPHSPCAEEADPGLAGAERSRTPTSSASLDDLGW